MRSVINCFFEVGFDSETHAEITFSPVKHNKRCKERQRQTD